MSDALTLYFCPLTCARVTLIALEQTGATYDLRLINVMAGEQKSPDYLAINPMGRVPALGVGERVLTENVSILLYLDEVYPQAALLPRSSDPVETAAVRSDLVWCATTLHPFVRQVRAPFHYTMGDQVDVRAKGVEAATPVLAHIDERLASADWWFGAQWSIVDAYIGWVAAGLSAAIDLSAYPAVVAHGARLSGHPAFQAMLKREAAAMADAGMQLLPGMER